MQRALIASFRYWLGSLAPLHREPTKQAGPPPATDTSTATIPLKASIANRTPISFSVIPCSRSSQARRAGTSIRRGFQQLRHLRRMPLSSALRSQLRLPAAAPQSARLNPFPQFDRQRRRCFRIETRRNVRSVLPHRVHSFAMWDDADPIHSPRSISSGRCLYVIQPLRNLGKGESFCAQTLDLLDDFLFIRNRHQEPSSVRVHFIAERVSIRRWTEPHSCAFMCRSASSCVWRSFPPQTAHSSRGSSAPSVLPPSVCSPFPHSDSK